MGETLAERQAKAAAERRNGTVSAPVLPTKNSGRPMPQPYQRFPVECLPRPLARLAEEGSQALGCDPAYVALPSLAVCAAAIGNNRELYLKNTWQEPSIIWTMIVGESGTLKTPPFKIAMRPLYQAERQWGDEYKQALRQWNADRERIKEDGGEQPDRPTHKRVYCADVTIEKLAEILEENPRGVLLARDELRGWLSSFCRYRAGSGSDLPNWLELFSAGVLTYDRKTGERRHVTVPRAACSVTGGIQPGILAKAVNNEHFDSGMVARILMAWPDRRKKKWTENDISRTTQENYHEIVDRLLNLQPFQSPGRPSMPHRLLLTSEAKAIWVDFYDSWAETQADSEGDLASAYSKLEGYAARLAMLHHIVTMLDLGVDDKRNVLPASVEAGTALIRWFAREAERVYASMRESEEQRDVRRLTEWVRSRGGATTARDLRRSNPARYAAEGSSHSALDSLVGLGFGCWVSRPSGEMGGRPTEEFHLAQELCAAKTAETPAQATEDPSAETCQNDEIPD